VLLTKSLVGLFGSAALAIESPVSVKRTWQLRAPASAGPRCRSSSIPAGCLIAKC